MEALFVYFFKYFIYFSTFLVSVVRNPTYSVLSLILVFLGGSCLFLFMGAEFLGFMLVVVYVGAVAVLFLFVVMMLGVTGNAESIFFFIFDKNRFFFYSSALLTVFFSFVYFFYSSFSNQFQVVNANGVEAPSWILFWDYSSNIQALGDMTYLYFFPLFFLCGTVLLVAMIGSIALTFSADKELKRQVVFDQISRDYALTLVKKN